MAGCGIVIGRSVMAGRSVITGRSVVSGRGVDPAKQAVTKYRFYQELRNKTNSYLSLIINESVSCKPI